MRVLSALTAATLFAGVALGPAGTASAQDVHKLKVGILSAHDFDPAYVALDKRFFAAHGLDVTITRIASVGNVPPAIFSGSVDIAPASPVALLQSAASGLDLVAVAGGARATPGSTDSSLIALKESNLSRPEDLVGKKIGVSSLNSFWNLMVKKWLVIHDVSPDRVTWVEVQLPVMRDALRTRSVDAVAAVEPFRSSMMQDPAYAVVSNYPAEVNPTVVESLWLASRSWSTAHKADLAGFQAAMAEANDFIVQHPDDARAVIATHWNVPPSSFPTYFSKLTPADFGFLVALTREFGVIDTNPDPASLIVAY